MGEVFRLRVVEAEGSFWVGLERAGQSDRGSITAIYTVLVEGGDMEEPIADEVRGVLDGHIVLDRAIAARGRYPAVDVTVSLSRVMDPIVSPAHRDAARRLRSLLGAYEQKRDLIALGAYARGSDPLVDQAIARMGAIESLLGQRPDERAAFDQAVTALLASFKHHFTTNTSSNKHCNKSRSSKRATFNRCNRLNT